MKDSRHFAAELMNRAGITFDAGDVALASSLIEQLEAELGAWLEVEMQGIVVVGSLISAVKSGDWRRDPSSTTG